MALVFTNIGTQIRSSISAGAVSERASIMTILANCPSCRNVRQVQEHDLCLGVMCAYCHNAYMDALDRPRGELQGGRQALSSSSYEVDLGQWFSYGAAHWTSILGPAIGFLLIQALVSFAIQTVGFVMLTTFTVFPGAGFLVMGLLLLTVGPLLEAGKIIGPLPPTRGGRRRFSRLSAASRLLWGGALLAFSWACGGLSLPGREPEC